MKTKTFDRKRIIAFVMLFVCVLALSLEPVIGVEAASQTSISYQASDYFSTTSVSSGPWSNQFYDFMGTGNKDQVSGYKDMGGTKERSELAGAPTVWVSTMADDDYTWGNHAAYAGATVMRTSTGTTNWVTYNSSFENYGWPGRNYPVKTFTAPEAGTVTIKAADALSLVSGVGTHVRIMKISAGAEAPAQVWPTENWQLISGTYTFEPINVAVNAGEKLTFECAYIKDGNSEPATVLSWNPVVEYVVSNAYKASEYFGSSNPNGPWAAMYYDYDAGGTVRSRYKNMEYFKESEWINHDPAVTTGSYQWGNNSARIGKTRMLADTYGNASDEEKNSVVGRDYPVRAFTAPNSGTITIKSELSTQRENGAHIRIMKFSQGDERGVQVWPAEGWESVTPGYAFSDITLDVRIGDVLTFENAFIYTKAGESPWDTDLNWDPIVEYEKIYPVLQTVIPADGANNVALNAVHTLTFDKAVRTVALSNVIVKEETADGSFGTSQAVCAASTVADSILSISFSGLKEYTKYQVTVGGIGYADSDESWVNSETYTFTTGSAVDTKPAVYNSATQTVTVEINNSHAEPVTADMLVFVCSGSETAYTITNAYILQRDDIGAYDTMTISGVTVPAGSFLKVAVLKDILTAVPYGDVTILGGE